MKNQKYIQQFVKCLEGIDRSRHSYDIFNDFLEMGAISLFNSLAKDPEIEQQYFEIIKRYKNPSQFSELLAITAIALNEKPYDFLGEVFMEAGFGNKTTGQFFTPYHISQLMAEMIISRESIQADIDRIGYTSLDEPCCGGGGMIIATAEVYKKLGFNYQKDLMFHATDIDIKCCYMTYIQTSLLGLTGIVVHGNTLSLESWKCFITPMSVLNPHFMNKYENAIKPKVAEVIPLRPKEKTTAIATGEK